MLVSKLVARTDTPGITARLLSMTWPVMAPRGSCAEAARAIRRVTSITGLIGESRICILNFPQRVYTRQLRFVRGGLHATGGFEVSPSGRCPLRSQTPPQASLLQLFDDLV